MVNNKAKQDAVLEAHKLAEIYKAGYIDGYNENKKADWGKIWKKCAKAFNKRFLPK